LFAKLQLAKGKIKEIYFDYVWFKDPYTAQHVGEEFFTVTLPGLAELLEESFGKVILPLSHYLFASVLKAREQLQQHFRLCFELAESYSLVNATNCIPADHLKYFDKTPYQEYQHGFTKTSLGA
jgi:hypothetical protein